MEEKEIKQKAEIFNRKMRILDQCIIYLEFLFQENEQRYEREKSNIGLCWNGVKKLLVTLLDESRKEDFFYSTDSREFHYSPFTISYEKNL